MQSTCGGIERGLTVNFTILVPYVWFGKCVPAWGANKKHTDHQATFLKVKDYREASKLDRPNMPQRVTITNLLEHWNVFECRLTFLSCLILTGQLINYQHLIRDILHDEYLKKTIALYPAFVIGIVLLVVLLHAIIKRTDLHELIRPLSIIVLYLVREKRRRRNELVYVELI